MLLRDRLEMAVSAWQDRAGGGRDKTGAREREEKGPAGAVL